MELNGIDVFKLSDEVLYGVAEAMGYKGDRFTRQEMIEWLEKNNFIKRELDFSEWIQKFRSEYVS